jgi:hypothetical protein
MRAKPSAWRVSSNAPKHSPSPPMTLGNMREQGYIATGAHQHPFHHLSGDSALARREAHSVSS